jgi:hypothetical protein
MVCIAEEGDDRAASSLLDVASVWNNHTVEVELGEEDVEPSFNGDTTG